MQMSYALGTDILKFSIAKYEVSVNIDNANKEVLCIVPSGITSGKDLIPTFSLSEGAIAYVNSEVQESGISRADFSTPVYYTIVNGINIAQWKVIVTNNTYTYQWGLGLFLIEEKSNESVRPGGWYVPQTNSGEFADINCGPACAVMAAHWANPAINLTVSNARKSIFMDKEIGWDAGKVFTFLHKNHIKVGRWVADYPFVMVAKANFYDQMKSLIDEGHIMIPVFNLKYIKHNMLYEQRTGNHYLGDGGHFVVIKGYKIVDNKMYLEIYDPATGGDRYKDGTLRSMNRYFLFDELYLAIITHNKEIIVVAR